MIFLWLKMVRGAITKQNQVSYDVLLKESNQRRYPYGRT